LYTRGSWSDDGYFQILCDLNLGKLAYTEKYSDTIWTSGGIFRWCSTDEEKQAYSKDWEYLKKPHDTIGLFPTLVQPLETRGADGLNYIRVRCCLGTISSKILEVQFMRSLLQEGHS
jgi:hypothetical protein